MFLHIGLNTALDVKDIVAVVNIEAGGRFGDKETALGKAEVIDVSGLEPRSLIVYDSGRRKALYLSRISSLTLRKRMEENI